jgi:hypothetical protein
MPTETRNRAEWERLLVNNHAGRVEDLPDELRELLRTLDEKLRAEQRQETASPEGN